MSITAGGFSPFTNSGDVLILFVVTKFASCRSHGLSYSRSSASNSSEDRFQAVAGETSGEYDHDPEVLRFFVGVKLTTAVGVAVVTES